MQTFICNVSIPEVGNQTRIVKAKNETQARAYLSRSHISVDKATDEELIELGAQGIKLESAL